MIKKNNELNGYMLLRIEQEFPYRGVDRFRFEPLLIESEMSDVGQKEPPTFIYEILPPGWRRTAYRIFEENLVEVLDALCDMQVILDGTFLEFGMLNIKEAAMKEVHLSNMTKLENGKPIYRSDGKILKGSKFKPPQLERYLEY